MTPARYLIEALRAGETVRFVARGTSMWPSVRDGATVEIVPCPVSALRIGDIGAYERGGQVVVHRVLATTGASLSFAGDGLKRPDGVVAGEKVLGRARVIRQPDLHARWPSRRHVAVMVRMALRGAAIAYVRGGAWLRRAEETSQTALAGLLGDALTSDEQRRIGVLFYDLSFREAAHPGPLRAWEQDWFARCLPKPPARLLVGGAGAGRESAALCASGYAIDALEPAPRPAHACQQVLGSRGEVFVACYEDVSRAVLDGSGGPAEPLAHRRYDAVVLGWGSLTHVLEADERLRLLESVCRLAPDGPILASFWLRPDPPPDLPDSVARPARGRADALGRAAGRLVGRVRGVPARDETVSFGSWYGFAHSFTRAELEALAARVGRRLVWGEHGAYPHVTFVAPDRKRAR
jgi:hypothetical protein